MTTKTVEQQALEFVKEIAAYSSEEYVPFYIDNLINNAQAIVDQMCSHENVKPKQYCQVCGWYHVPTKR